MQLNVASKIKFDNAIYVSLQLEDGKLRYELEYDSDNYDGEPDKLFKLYKITDGIYYRAIFHSAILKNKPLKDGEYLFIFNRTKLSVKFTNNEISYKLEDLLIDTEPDLS
jgi:hypothetical protein